jgi:hypothetical protein
MLILEWSISCSGGVGGGAAGINPESVVMNVLYAKTGT